MLSTVVVLVLVVGLWFLTGRDADTGTDLGAVRDTSSSTSTGTSTPTRSTSTVDPVSGLDLVDVSDLPAEAVSTIDLIDDGGPFPYAKDGSTFGNFEGILPDRSRGYYAEYTVETPGSDDRGARRIVTGDEGELYWTADHYDSFERVRR